MSTKVEDSAKADTVAGVTDFITTHGKLSEDGTTRQVPASAYYDMMGGQFALTRPVLEQVADANNAIAAGMVAVGTSDLVALIEKAKAAGDDPKGLVSSVRIATPQGGFETDIHASKSIANPNDGSRTERPGVVKFRIKTANWVEPAAAEKTRATIGAILGE